MTSVAPEFASGFQLARPKGKCALEALQALAEPPFGGQARADPRVSVDPASEQSSASRRCRHNDCSSSPAGAPSDKRRCRVLCPLSLGLRKGHP
jgi:hypothetical protein